MNEDSSRECWKILDSVRSSIGVIKFKLNRRSGIGGAWKTNSCLGVTSAGGWEDVSSDGSDGVIFRVEDSSTDIVSIFCETLITIGSSNSSASSVRRGRS